MTGDIAMTRTALFAASALALIASVAQAQIVIDSQPVVTTYYAPAPTVSYYAPSVSAAPAVTYSPAITSAPVTTYYAPTTTYYAPTTTALYAPTTTTYYAGTAVVTPVTVTGRPITYGSSAYGTFRPYVPGQPVRNSFRFFVP
jgi:hypothetical protein